MGFPNWMRRDVAARYLLEVHGVRRAPATLAKLACVGGGPKFRKDGRWPLYSQQALDEWATGHLSPEVASTSELRINEAA